MSTATPELIADLTTRLEQALRRADLMERRMAVWEKDLSALQADLRRFAGQTQRVDESTDQVSELEARLARLENRSLHAAARNAVSTRSTAVSEPSRPALNLTGTDDASALVFARWVPIEATSGEAVTLRVKCDGFEPGDIVQVIITELGAEGPLEPLPFPVPEGRIDELSFKWRSPSVPKDTHREYTFVARGRGHEARSPVLTVRG